MKELNSHKPKFSPYLEKLYNSDQPLIIYKVNGGYNLYTDFSKKITNEKGYTDNLRIATYSKEYENFVRYEAHK